MVNCGQQLWEGSSESTKFKVESVKLITLVSENEVYLSLFAVGSANSMKLSIFGEKYTRHSGIVELMDDLGNALSVNPDMISMGGGNPARIPEVETILHSHLKNVIAEPEKLYAMLGKYQPPQGDDALLKQMADFLASEYGWPLTKKNIAISNGGQSAFYVVSNLLAGRYADGSYRQIQFPLVPEYLGYADTGLEDHFFTAARPSIEILEEHIFKYRVDFNALKITENTGAICVSRPTNPTGNVLTDNEVTELDHLARKHDIPFIIDAAYGAPFPNIIFTETTPHWSEHTILLLSLSKLGLPGVRTGFIVASEEVIHAYATANTILNLACGNVGPTIARELFKGGEILRISSELIMPYYRDKAMQALEWFMEELGDLPFYIHKPEGAMFLWIWFKDLPVSCQQLYECLKQRGVLVIPGHNSFVGLSQDWQHTRECIRVSYAQDGDRVKKGIKIIAEEVKRVYLEA